MQTDRQGLVSTYRTSGKGRPWHPLKPVSCRSVVVRRYRLGRGWLALSIGRYSVAILAVKELFGSQNERNSSMGTVLAYEEDVTMTALWKEEDYGIIADRSCWAMFAVLTGNPDSQG